MVGFGFSLTSYASTAIPQSAGVFTIGSEKLGQDDTPVISMAHHDQNASVKLMLGYNGDSTYISGMMGVSGQSHFATVALGASREQSPYQTTDNQSVHQNAGKLQLGANRVMDNGVRVGVQAGYQAVGGATLGTTSNTKTDVSTTTTPQEIITTTTTTTTTTHHRIVGSKMTSVGVDGTLPVGEHWAVTGLAQHHNLRFNHGQTERFSSVGVQVQRFGRHSEVYLSATQNIGDRDTTTVKGGVRVYANRFATAFELGHNNQDGNSVMIGFSYPAQKHLLSRPKTAQDYNRLTVNHATLDKTTAHTLTNYSTLVSSQQQTVEQQKTVQTLRTPDIIKAEVEKYMNRVTKEINLWYNGDSEYTFDLSGLPNDATITLISLTEISDRGP